MSCCDKNCQDENISTECKIRKLIKQLPPQEKIKSLSLFQLHLQLQKSEELMNKEISIVEQQCFDLQQPLLLKQQQIICGERSPIASELENLQSILTQNEKSNFQQLISQQKPQRIDNYWIKVFENCELLCDIMTAKDKFVLKYLDKIQVEKEIDTYNYKYTFIFSKNENFENQILTKKFFMKDEQTPIRSEGTKILWQNGKDLTKRTIQKKQKNQQTGQIKSVEKQIKEDSFFNFFESIDVSETALKEIKDDDEAEEIQDQMDIDLQISQILDEAIIPCSIEYYQGILNKNDSNDEKSDDSYDDDSFSDFDFNSDDDFSDKKKIKGSDKKEKQESKPECKQQ